MDNFIGKRARARREARKAARAAGKSRKEARGLGRLAKRQVKERQLRARGKNKRADRVIARGTESGAKIFLQNAALAPLLPLRKAMTKVLVKRGLFTKGMSFPNVVNKFFNAVVSKKGNKASQYDAIEDNYIHSHPSASIYLEDVETQEDYDNFIGAIGNVVTAIINFFKKRKNDKLAKKQMTPEDSMIADEAIFVEEQLLMEQSDSQPITREDIKNASGKEKRTLRKLFRNQRKSQGGLNDILPFNTSQIQGSAQPRQGGFLSGLGNVLGGMQNQQLNNQMLRNQQFRGGRGLGGNRMMPIIIGVIAFIGLAYILLKNKG